MTFEHRSKSHMEFTRGCQVRLENGKGELYTLTYPAGPNGNGIDVWTVDVPIEAGGGITNAPINQFIHACSGALDAGGEC